jgi:hypothetical protein
MMVMDKKEQAAYDAAMAEYFAKGGKITVCPVNERTEDLEVNVWKRGPGRPKKADAEKNEE